MPIYNKIWNALIPLYNKIWNALIPIYNKIWNALIHIYNKIWNALIPIYNKIWNTLIPIYKKIWNALIPIYNKIWNAKTVVDLILTLLGFAFHHHHQNIHQGPGRHYYLQTTRTTPVTHRINKVELINRPNIPCSTDNVDTDNIGFGQKLDIIIVKFS
jgi:hypothetical protein